MAKPVTPTTQTFIDAVTALIALRDDLNLTEAQTNQLQQGVRVIIGRIQDRAFNSADALAQSYLATNRKFITNTTLADIFVTFDSTSWEFDAAAIWCVDSGELDFFLSQVNYNGTLAQTTLAAWLAGGVNSFVGAVYW